MNRRQYHVLIIVAFGAGEQESGGLSAMANNPEVFLVRLTHHILFLVRGTQGFGATTVLLYFAIFSYLLIHAYTHGALRRQRGDLLHLPSISVCVWALYVLSGRPSCVERDAGLIPLLHLTAVIAARRKFNFCSQAENKYRRHTYIKPSRIVKLHSGSHDKPASSTLFSCFLLM